MTEFTTEFLGFSSCWYNCRKQYNRRHQFWRYGVDGTYIYDWDVICEAVAYCDFVIWSVGYLGTSSLTVQVD